MCTAGYKSFEMSKNTKKRKLDRDDTIITPRDSKQAKAEDRNSTQSANCDFLKQCSIYILQAGIGKARCDLFNKQIVNNGGTFESTFGPTVTHLVIDEKMEVDRMCRIMKIDEPPQKIKIVKSLWLSACLKEKKYVDSGPFEVKKVTAKVLVQPEKVKTLEPMPGPSHTAESEPHITKVSTDYDKNTDDEKEGSTKPKVNYPQVGYMHRFSAKPKPGGDADVDDADSDYVPSGEEDEAMSEALDSPSSPSSQSMQRRLPVCTRTASIIYIFQCNENTLS